MWVEKVHCMPCRGTTDWVIKDGSWTCFHCGTVMSPAEIKKYHYRLDVEVWLAAEREWGQSRAGRTLPRPSSSKDDHQ